MRTILAPASDIMYTIPIPILHYSRDWAIYLCGRESWSPTLIRGVFYELPTGRNYGFSQREKIATLTTGFGTCWTYPLGPGLLRVNGALKIKTKEKLPVRELVYKTQHLSKKRQQIL